jgi:hypothetical protein
MQRLSIVEKLSGCILFDQVWQWEGSNGQTADFPKQSSIAKIVQLFFNFAKEVDKGNVRRVMFDKGADSNSASSLKKKSHKQQTYYNDVHNLSLNAKELEIDKSFTIRSKPIEMWCQQNEQVIIAIFIASDQFTVRRLYFVLFIFLFFIFFVFHSC